MKLLNLSLASVVSGMLFTSCNFGINCVQGEGDVVTRNLNLDTFTGVSVSGSTEVYIQRGNEQRVELEGQANILDLLETEIDNDEVFQVGFNGCVSDHKTVKVYITMPELEYAAVSGSGLVELQDSFRADDFKARVSGSGEIVARIAANNISARTSGSGSILLAGITNELELGLSGSGKVRAYDLQTNAAEVDISGSGSAEVAVEEDLEVEISGSGKVYYKGEPDIISDVSGSGKVIKS
ncbi:head GIN domain-containing protein [Pontibacter silvestris]|uniref:Head GIN domain-containing protein n=1 Tax=Pontibacter silvestris TaxID=2305183 RepID=A0ABW4X1Z7_9BACT|nr:head GIN domain-containing protein [Pontibacter silvestris]MCC9135001.1 DUF2807 domain-containing protein [Pontibacter silvestris]